MNDERQVILISGGSRGLGRALVADLLERGHVVATFSRSSSPFIQDQQQRDPQSRAFIWEAMDGADHERVKTFVTSVARRYGRIDVLINNAATALEGILTLTRASDIHRTVALNLEGAIYLAQAGAKVMLQQQGGNIVNVTSIVGLRGHTGLSVYSATKAALDGFTRSLAKELGPKGIRVNAVAPGYLDTEMSAALTAEQRARIVRRTPLGRLGAVQDVVGVVRFLISPEARFITGQTLVVDGGLTC